MKPLLSCSSAILLLAACDMSPPVDPCDARLDALERRLEAAAATSEPSGAPPDVALPRHDTGTRVEGTPPLMVVSWEVVFGGRGVGGLDDVDRTAETLRADLRAWATTHEAEEPYTVLLWVAPDVTVDALTRLLRHAPEEARFALLVRGAPVDADPDEPAWIERALSAPAGNPVSQRAHLDEAWGRATRQCERAAAHLPVPAPLAPAGPSLGVPTVSGLMRALRACRCEGTDLSGIEAVARRALVDADGPVHRLPATLRFGPATGSGAELEFGPSDTLDDLVERVDAREGTVWIRVD